MTVARPGSASVVRRSSKALLVAGLALLCLAVAVAAAPTKAEANQVCGGSQVSLPRSLPVATASKRAAGVIGWLGARAATAFAEKGFLTGIETLGSLAGHQSAGDQVLRQLGDIRGQLNEVDSQLGRIQNHLRQISATADSTAFKAAMDPLCFIVNQQRSLFVELYEPLMKNGYLLAEILHSDNPGRADAPYRGGPHSLRQIVDGMLGDFMRRARLRDDEGDWQTMRRVLVPDWDNGRTTILSLYGRVLMNKRFLTQTDSLRMRHLYQELAEVRAIATWMSGEYWSGRPGREDLVALRRTALARDSRVEESNLPPMIPPGVVIDLGSGPNATLRGKPMWYAPTDQDVGWLRGPLEGFDPATGKGFQIFDDGVGNQIRDLNQPPSVLQALGLGKGWKPPTKQEFQALISNGCEVDPGNPSAFRDAVPCSNAVTAASGGTVGGYLEGVNSGNDRWRHLFCTSPSDRSPCRPGTGPDPETGRHLFVWTSDLHSERADCGSSEQDARSTRYRRSWITYTGFRTTTSEPEWRAFPALVGGPSRPAWRTTAEQSYNVCDAWLVQRLATAPKDGVLTKGVLLATRFVSQEDGGQRNGLDYMGQWSATR